MKRRDFLKKGLALGAITMIAGPTIRRAHGFSEHDTIRKGKKSMKILVITGSPRKGGNSSVLADSFIKGATESGHTVVRFDAAFKKVNPCTGCNHCGMDGPCIFNDDFNFIRDNIVDADAVVFASPMYYFGLSAQLKAVIDRFYAINGQIHVPKKAVLLMTYANTASSQAKPIISHYETLLSYLGWTDAGQVIASGVWQIGDVNRTDYPKQAYELGKNI